MKKILAISGGLDSLTIYFMKKKFIDDCVYIDYGQKFKKRETDVLNKLNIKYFIIKIKYLDRQDNGFFDGRNLHFLIAIREFYKNQNIVVYFGNCSEDNFSDNSREYFFRLEKIMNDSYSDTIRIICPLENMVKKEIHNIYVEAEKETSPYWCDSGGKYPCGKCHSCLAMKQSGLLK